MRVIAGEFRSRKLKSMPGMEVRPTPDRLREALFSILAPEIEGAVFVDAYAGTGAVGIEAISRGAAKAVFLEKNREAAALITENLMSLRALDRAQVVRGSVQMNLPRHGGDIIFIDPPYSEDKQYDLSLEVAATLAPRLLLVQHDAKRQLPERCGGMSRVRVLRQGDNSITFYRPAILDPQS